MSSASSARSRWSPPPMHMRTMSPRMGDRLPPLADYSSMMRHHWDSAPHGHNPAQSSREASQSPRSHAASFRNNGPEQPGHMGYFRPPTAHSQADVNGLESRRDSTGVVATPKSLNGDGPTSPVNASIANGANDAKHPAPPVSSSDPTSEPPKKKKRRQAFSCAECAKRKQKCNRETPCQHCVNRKVPHLCIPSSRLNSPPSRAKPTAKADGDNAPSPAARVAKNDDRTATTPMPALGSRVTKIERMLNAVLNRVDGLDSSALIDWRQCECCGSVYSLSRHALNCVIKRRR